MATWIVGAQTIGRTLGEILNHSLLVTTPRGAIIAAVPLTDGGAERAKLIASAPDLANEHARLQGALLKLLIATNRDRDAGARYTADAVREAKALVPVTCEHCPDHPHPLDDDETPCRFPRPAPGNQPAPDVQAALADALEQVKAALGDRLLGKGPLSKEYAHSVMRQIDAALRKARRAP